jgi:predicted XRE-type DNA-binding protein
MALDSQKTARVQAMGGRVTTVEEWLDLTPEEVAIIDMKIRLGELIKKHRRMQRLSQEHAARILKTSQGRISKLERGQASLDQLVWSMLALGGSQEKLAKAISG